jgi:hypothetical protein
MRCKLLRSGKGGWTHETLILVLLLSLLDNSFLFPKIITIVTVVNYFRVNHRTLSFLLVLLKTTSLGRS